MVHHCSPSDRPQGEGATDTDDRKMFRIRSGNPVDGAEGAYAVRDDKSGQPVQTRVSICRIGRIELIAVSDPLRSSAILELLNKLKIEITGHTKDMSNPILFQSPQQEITDCLFHRFRSSRLERLSNTRDPMVPCFPHLQVIAGGRSPFGRLSAARFRSRFPPAPREADCIREPSRPTPACALRSCASAPDRNPPAKP